MSTQEAILANLLTPITALTQEQLDSQLTLPQLQLVMVLGLDAQDVTYNAIGNAGYSLCGGVDYSVNKGMKAELEVCHFLRSLLQ